MTKAEQIASYYLARFKSINPDTSRFISTRVHASSAQILIVQPFIERMDKFINWLIVGFAAILALCIGNLDKASGAITVVQIKDVLPMFFIAIALAGIHKLVAACIASSVEASKATKDLTAQLKKDTLDFEILADFTSRIELAHPVGMRWILRHQLSKAIEGDWDYASRKVVHISVYATLLITTSLIFILSKCLWQLLAG